MVDRYDEELFLEYVEGELPVEKRVAFENQMLQDPRLRNLVAQMVLDRHRMRTLPDEAPPEHLMDAVHERLERAMLLGASPQEFTQTKKPTNHGFRWRRYATMAAMAAMVSIVAGVFIVTLVQLANETPIRNIGPGSLFPPGMQSNLLPPNRPVPPPEPAEIALIDPDVDPAVDPVDASTDAATSTTPDVAPPDIALALPPASVYQDSPDHANDTSTESINAGADSTNKTQLSSLPVAQIVLLVTTADVTAASRRLVAWSNAYDAKLLDSREVSTVIPNKNVVAPQAALPTDTKSATKSATLEPDQANPSTSANQPLAITPVPVPVPASTPAPTPSSRVLVTLSLPSNLTETLKTFLATLPQATVQSVQASDDAVDNTKPRPANASPLPYVLRDRNAQQQSPQQLTHPSNALAPMPSSPTLLDLMLPDQTYLPAWLLNPDATVWHLTPRTALVPTHTVVRLEFTTQQ